MSVERFSGQDSHCGSTIVWINKTIWKYWLSVKESTKEAQLYFKIKKVKIQLFQQLSCRARVTFKVILWGNIELQCIKVLLIDCTKLSIVIIQSFPFFSSNNWIQRCVLVRWGKMWQIWGPICQVQVASWVPWPDTPLFLRGKLDPVKIWGPMCRDWICQLPLWWSRPRHFGP